jgi:SAM-dependent methyltransferase
MGWQWDTVSSPVGMTVVAVMSEAEHNNPGCLQHWYRSPLGSLLADAELELINGILRRLFGYNIIALGVPSGRDLLAESPILHRYRIDSAQPVFGAPLDLLAQPACLPVASDCMDVVVVPHVLECAGDPDAVLREVDRVLIPEGHVILLGFNPASLWGAWRALATGRRQTVWRRQFISATKVSQWLTSLGFQVVSIRYGFYRPPLQRRGLLKKFTWMECLGIKWWPRCGGFYVLTAKKRVSTLTLIKPRWHSRPLFTEGVVNRPIGKQWL